MSVTTPDFIILAISKDLIQIVSKEVVGYEVVQFVGELLRLAKEQRSVVCPEVRGEDYFVLVAVRSTERNVIIETMSKVEAELKELYRANPNLGGVILSEGQAVDDVFCYTTRRIINSVGNAIVP